MSVLLCSCVLMRLLVYADVLGVVGKAVKIRGEPGPYADIPHPYIHKNPATTACGPVRWQIDDSILPLGDAFGETNVGIYTGSVNQQTLFFDIGTVSDPTSMLELPAVTIPGE